MTWGSHCSICGREDCDWVNGDLCDGLLKTKPPSLPRERSEAGLPHPSLTPPSLNEEDT